MKENEIGKIIVDAALTVHRPLGPGLLELVHEVIKAGANLFKADRAETWFSFEF
jgi:hypothetical protein